MNRSEHTLLSEFLPVLALSSATIILHFIANAMSYGYFRDELYYLACANHPDIGYVDHPPLSIWLLSVSRTLLGESVFAVRAVPALVHAAVVLLAGSITLELHGSRFAQFTASLCTALCPVMLGMSGIYNMNPYDLLLWASTFFALLRLLRTDEPRWWIVIGVVLGIGAMNKISILWLAFGLAAGVSLTEHRRWFKTRWPWIAAAIAAVIFLPFIIWNAQHDFAHVEFARRAATQKYASQNPLTFFSGLLLINNPLTLPVWLAGFWFLLKNKEHRVIGISIAVVLLILIVNVHSKSEYFTAAMTPLFAAGAVVLEQFTEPVSRRWLRSISLLCIVATGLTIAPLSIDLLPVNTFIRYQAALGVAPPSTEGQHLEGLPQHFADRFGWRELADTVARVYRALPEDVRKDCAVMGGNYGEAAAMDFFGRAMGLPPAISQHNSYFYWSLKEYRGAKHFIIIRERKEDLESVFESVEESATLHADYAMPYENAKKVYLCKNLKVPFEPVWKQGKDFN